VRHRKLPSQTQRTFLDNHVRSLVSVDFFTVPTIRFPVLYVFLVLARDRRRVSTLMSPLISRRNGRHSNCAKHFRSIKFRAICPRSR
jgi:hypothetical protein